MIAQYTLSKEQAGRIPTFYFPEVSEKDIPKGIRIFERFDDQKYPYLRLIVEPNTRCNIHLNENKSVIYRVVLITDPKKGHIEDFNNAKRKLEDIFGFKLVKDEISGDWGENGR